MRKALVIGLGGTGTSICRSLAERLRWEFDDLKRLEFVDFFAMDTSKDTVINSLLDNPSNFYDLKISEQTFSDMRDHPESFDTHNLFSKWYNPEVMNIQNAVEDGTSGLRMLGRMAMLLPANWTYLYETINRKISDLVALTPAAAQQKFGKRYDGTVPTFTFPNKVYVYIVATACGGTGSGTFMEMGYLLRQLKKQSYADTLTTIGILTLPAASEQDSYRKANAYAVLTELNHFSTDYNEYRDKYPNIPSPVTVYNYPYDFPYLVTIDINRAQQGGLADFKALNETVAQYIYSDLFLDVATVRDGRRNDVSRMFISSDRKGMSQRFMTFGASFIQYPVERIMRGCANKLLTHTFDRWLADHKAVVPQFVYTTLSMSPDDLFAALSKTSADSIEERLDQHIDNIMAPGNYTGMEDLVSLTNRLDAAFQDAGVVAPTLDSTGVLPKGFVLATRDQNCARATENCLKNLKTHIDGAIADLNRGPGYCIEFLRRVSSYCMDRQNAKAPVESAETNQLRTTLQLVAEDVLLRFPIPFVDKVQSYYLEQWCRSLKVYNHQRLQRALLPAQQQICRAVDEEANRLKLRIENLETYLHTGRNRFRKLWEEQDKAFAINGLMLFTPGSVSGEDDIRKRATITMEYANQLKTQPSFSQMTAEQAETAAMQQVVTKLKPIAIADDANRNDIFALQGLSFFDTSGSGTNTKFQKLRGLDEDLCINSAKPFFLEVRKRNVIEAFQNTYGAQEREPLLRKTSDLSDWFLPLSINATEYEDHARKRNRWAFYPDAGNTAAGTYVEEFRDMLDRVAPTGTTHMPLSDPHTALFLSEYGAFPLRIISGVEEWRQYYLAAMGKSDDQNSAGTLTTPSGKDVPTLFNREDIVWIGFNDTDRDLLYKAEENILVGLALGEIQSLQNSDGFIFQTSQLRGRDPLTLDANLRKSARKLSIDPNYTRALGDIIYRRREGGEKDREIIEILYTDFPKGRLQVIGLTGIQGKDNDERAAYVKAVFNRFISRKNNEGLLRAYNDFSQPRQTFDHLYRQHDTIMDPADPSTTYPEDGYYCENCHQFFGTAATDVPPQCWKQTCGHIYYYIG